MKVKNLIKLLKNENLNAEVGVWLGAEEGWDIVEIVSGDAIIGKIKTDSDDFVLLPVQVPNKLNKWEENEETR